MDICKGCAKCNECGYGEFIKGYTAKPNRWDIPSPHPLKVKVIYSCKVKEINENIQNG